MNIQFTQEQLALRDELRAYFAQLMTPELRAECERDMGEGGGPLWREALRQMGRDGWIGVGWPESWGGRGLTPLEQFIFVEEVMRAGYPFPFLTTESVGPILAEHGNDWIRAELVPKILQGELLIAIGYSEPGAGTDLASLKTSAVRDGDDWVINGQKMWTSLAHFCDYTWLAVRTDPDAPKKHKGISMFLVPNSDPGWSCTPVHTLGGVRTNATYYDNIRVSADHLVGDLNGGWKLITGQLNRERLSLINFGPISQLFNQVTRWARETDLPAGGRVADQPWVQQNLGRCRALIECMKLIVYKQSWAMTVGALEMADASAAKVYGSEGFIEIYRMLGEVVGQAGLLRSGSGQGSAEAGKIERLYRTASIITFGGGANEIQRDIISAAGLWMPRASR
ncbi:MAG: acyl-CoA dehydrogenase family protein [Halieaceae bacterium]|nr:acyl-CoA dehydrogenase family protein [Halieaceae bacterium]MCP5146537.1 acyl-CoA dehydrogenase family protein [Pseudomonadales bacterium]MCP5166441.1 acyl-CoA dehydrogenase family protein [Pseudomonadales bacterium]MCP5186335.1 acyl-CoA dehydrogenase family protein [Pseudomonadales bacterium]